VSYVPKSYEEMFPGRFLKAGLFCGRDVTLTIAGFERYDSESKDGGVEERVAIAFRETPRQLAVNQTNGQCIKAMFGAPDAWVGKRVTLYPTTTQLGTETVEAIRVRGSPDLAQDMTCTVKLKKKRPIQMRLTKTQQTKPAEPAKEA